MFKDKNPNFSLSRYITFMVVGIGLLLPYVFGVRNKAFVKWLNTADWTWGVLALVVLAVMVLIGFMIETGKKSLTYVSIAVAVFVTAFLLMSGYAAAAFSGTNWFASLVIIAVIAILAIVGKWMATGKHTK